MKKLLIYLFLLLPLAIASCGGDDKDEPIVNPENPNVDNQQQISEYVFPGDFNLIYESYSNGWCYVKVSYHHNGVEMLNTPTINISTNGANIKAVDVGKVSSITDIKVLPTEGWVNYPTFSVDLYKGYIVEIYKDSYFRYYRLFISSYDKSASGEVVGVRIKYQQFNPTK